jgi:hypothetical protein
LAPLRRILVLDPGKQDCIKQSERGAH